MQSCWDWSSTRKASCIESIVQGCLHVLVLHACVRCALTHCAMAHVFMDASSQAAGTFTEAFRQMGHFGNSNRKPRTSFQLIETWLRSQSGRDIHLADETKTVKERARVWTHTMGTKRDILTKTLWSYFAMIHRRNDMKGDGGSIPDCCVLSSLDPSGFMQCGGGCVSKGGTKVPRRYKATYTNNIILAHAIQNTPCMEHWFPWLVL
jgi:hypothetical protein